MSTINTDKGICVSSVSKRETPVTPPSIKLLGSKKPLSPKPAAIIPIIINKLLLISALMVTHFLL
jgi:hypothetical protein